MPASLIGQTLGNFSVEAEIGKGSMARVYKARQLPLDRYVALKVLEESLFTPGDNIKRFLREASALARLEHPHIVPVYSAGEQLPYYFFAMRLITGGTLADAMHAGIGTRTAVEWACQVCRALAYSHQMGIVHRDLKPTNILLQYGVAFMSDFGLARLRDLSTLTKKGMTLGTPMYMSPEQTRGDEAGPASDCFALGVILYQMLTGVHPFLEASWKEKPRAERRTLLFKRIREGGFRPAVELNAEVTPALDAFIRRAMAGPAAERYATGEEMLKDLEEAWREVEDGHAVVATVSSEDSSHKHAAVKPSSAALGETEAVPGPARREPGQSALHRKVGTRFGRYVLKSEVGHGGQGVVYQAHDPVLDRDVALKVLQAPYHADEAMLKQFQHEARSAARLSHPHIISIFDFGVEAGHPYLTMPLIDGPSLERILRMRAPLPLPLCLRVLRQSAEALAYAHSRGVVHLDVKPGNILLSCSAPALECERAEDLRDPSTVITDFTLAKWVAAPERADEPRAEPERAAQAVRSAGGTLPYASPEQIAGDPEKIGAASDYFSLGAVFHEMLTGRRLFDRKDLTATQVLVLDGRVAPPSASRAGLPPEIDAVCLEMLASQPSARLQSAKALVRRIAAFMHPEED
ncbi:MAG: serine/threonine protein kinase [Planctomycetota bacterium]|nr:serine/threonine protein kinase [Planctomycetota bacterium]